MDRLDDLRTLHASHAHEVLASWRAASMPDDTRLYVRRTTGESVCLILADDDAERAARELGTDVARSGFVLASLGWLADESNAPTYAVASVRPNGDALISSWRMDGRSLGPQVLVHERTFASRELGLFLSSYLRTLATN